MVKPSSFFITSHRYKTITKTSNIMGSSKSGNKKKAKKHPENVILENENISTNIKVNADDLKIFFQQVEEKLATKIKLTKQTVSNAFGLLQTYQQEVLAKLNLKKRSSL